MAVSSLVVPPDPKRDARARVLSGQVSTWPTFTLKQPWGSFAAGTTFRRAPSGRDPKVRYLVNSVACQCPDYADRGFICKHVRAIVLWEAAQQPSAAATASKLLKTYEELFPACAGGCGDVADTRDGFCDRCASEREYQQRMATRSHARVVEGWL